MTIRGVFFDFDGTLCDTASSRPQRAQRAFEALRREGHAIDWRWFLRSLLSHASDGFIRGMAPVIEDLGLSNTAVGRECIGYWFFEGTEDLLVPYPGVFETLKRLRERYRLGVITNGPEETQRRKFEALGLQDYFDVFVSSGAVGHLKPAPEIFRHALAGLGVSAHEALHVGDICDADVAGAQGAGMRGVWFNPEGFAQPFDVTPDATISRIADLPALIEKWDAALEGSRL